MARVRVSTTADADIVRILAAIAREAGGATARKFNARFEALFDTLEAFPDSCPARPALGLHIRVGVVYPYLVIHRHVPGEDDDVVGIVRILHGRRRITRKLVNDN